MSDIHAEDAVTGAYAREEAVRAASVVFDRDLAVLREQYSLPTDGQQWASAFAARLASRNKEYRLRVKQDLHAAAHNLKCLYSKGDESDSQTTSHVMSTLMTFVIGALRSTACLKAQLNEYTVLHDKLTNTGSLSLPDRVFIRRSFPDLTMCLDHLEQDGDLVKSEFKKFKQSFYVIAFEHELKKCQEALSARKAIRQSVEEKVRPSFKLLTTLLAERAAIVEESADLGLNQTMTWFGSSTERVPLDEYNRELQRYNVLIARIQAHKTPHEGAVALVAVSRYTIRPPLGN
ncbi:hypothetical protein TRAPUB_13861 [Trametes pubescens]|uniref:Uncharacterized protein n=1 Tax=Trametes pubescens TaxID=154538 RepID=A0A1M2VPY2_TRAPU|nr:hypothetical protein TRAPUB_13861 [Trametes pubescens]